MGRVTDDGGRVKGLDGLRVVDASIFPIIPSANLNAPVIMMAEKIAAAMTPCSRTRERTPFSTQ